MYATLPLTLQEFRRRITDACVSVSPSMLYSTHREVQFRVQMCIVADGHHFQRIDEYHFWKENFVQPDKKKNVFCTFNLYHFSMQLYKWLFARISYLFEIKMLTLFLCSSCQFTIHELHFHDYSSYYSEIIGVTMDFSGHTVCTYNCILKQKMRITVKE